MSRDFQDYMPKPSRKASAPEFQIERKVASGGMGAIYQALDVRINRRVAMKVLRPDRVARRDNVLRFVREAKITARLQHPNIVPVHYFGEDEEGLPFYIMKLVKGESLEEMLDRIRSGEAGTIQRYPLAKLLAIFLKVCDALAYAHAKDIVHRDIKPDNIMLGDYGEVLVMDWGLAKEMNAQDQAVLATEVFDEDDEDDLTAMNDTLGDDDSYETLHTMPGMILGSPSYMAPEQVAGEVRVDARTDVYGLGGLLYCLLTLYPPHSAESIDETRRLQETGNIPPPANFNPSFKARVKGLLFRNNSDVVFELPHCPGGHIPEPLSEICMHALANDVKDRYASVRELQDDIIDFLQQGQMQPPPPT